MNLLDEIRADLTNETARLSPILRKVRVLAEDLQSQELREWVQFELGGYPDVGSTPGYRRFSVPVYGTFHVPFQTRMTQVIITTYGLPEDVRNVIDTLTLTDGVAALNEMLASGEAMFHKMLSVEHTQLLRQHNSISGGMLLFEAYQQFPRHLLASVLDNIQNRLLEFVLDLQEKKVTPENLNSDNSVHGAIGNSFNFHFHGGHPIVAAGENVHQEFSVIHKGDVNSLIDYLRARNVGDEDLDDLKVALAAEPGTTNGGFGSKVIAWIGKMTEKALNGVWQSGVANAPAMLVQAIQQFYWGII